MLQITALIEASASMKMVPVASSACYVRITYFYCFLTICSWPENSNVSRNLSKKLDLIHYTFTTSTGQTRRLIETV